MPLPVGVGDIIAAGSLGWQLYRQVYSIARDAPEEVQALTRVLSETHNVTKAIMEDLELPDSPIVQSGLDRLSLASRIAKETERLLKDLEALLHKTDLITASSRTSVLRRGFWRRNWQRLRYAKEARAMNELRAKVCP